MHNCSFGRHSETGAYGARTGHTALTSLQVLGIPQIAVPWATSLADTPAGWLFALASQPIGGILARW